MLEAYVHELTLLTAIFIFITSAALFPQAYKILKKPLITDDTAIYFEGYPGFPGTFTKFVFQGLGFSGGAGMAAS